MGVSVCGGRVVEEGLPERMTFRRRREMEGGVSQVSL